MLTLRESIKCLGRHLKAKLNKLCRDKKAPNFRANKTINRNIKLPNQ